ncbi:hypothetical protein G6F56_013001 [Rhizopus delemar]|nr:hypothetical protein G6F56_013001 [Rhizopus delemar]
MGNSTSAFGAQNNTTVFGSTSNNVGAFGSTNTLEGESAQTHINTNGDPNLESFANKEFTYRHIPEIEPPIELR